MVRWHADPNAGPYVPTTVAPARPAERFRSADYRLWIPPGPRLLRGIILDYALGEGLVGPAAAAGDGGSGSPSADDLRRAIERACQEVPLRPLERAVGATLRQSRAVLLSTARRIGTRLRGPPGQPRSRRCSGSPGTEPGQDEQVGGVAALLQRRIASAVPEAHYRELRERFRAHLPGRP